MIMPDQIFWDVSRYFVCAILCRGGLAVIPGSKIRKKSGDVQNRADSMVDDSLEQNGMVSEELSIKLLFLGRVTQLPVRKNSRDLPFIVFADLNCPKRNYRLISQVIVLLGLHRQTHGVAARCLRDQEAEGQGKGVLGVGGRKQG